MRPLKLLLVGLVTTVGLASVQGLRAASANPATPPPHPVAAATTPTVPGQTTTPAAAPAPTDPKAARQAAREEMKKRIDEILQRPVMQRGRVGVEVVSVDTGEELYSHDANDLFNPASNVKLFTSAVALAKLGPEYRYHTDFFCSTEITRGECKTLYIRGRGDPTLWTERIYGIVGELEHRGLRRVGEIIVDDSFFDSEREGPGWEQEDGDRAYTAPVGALSVNHNTVAIYVSPGDAVGSHARVDLEPASEYFVIENSVKTVSRRSRARLRPHSYYGKDGRQHIVVSGRLPVNRDTAVFYKKVDNPPLYAGETFKAIFKERGVAVRGKVRRGLVPDDAHRLYLYKSPALAEVIREMNKVSNNFIAEMLLKTVGAEVKGAPGTWPKGVDVAEDYLATIGIPRGSYVMKNGSGLNDTNRFTPAQIIKLLSTVANKTTYYPEYASSLGIAGRDGTIHARMDGSIAEGRLRGKTGTLENVTALSGYVTLTSGETLAYSILVNGLTRRQHGASVASIDAMGIAIASGGGPEQQAPGLLAAGSAADLKARVATFASLAKVPNPDNLPFLHSALRVEQDPVLRAVIADSIYRSDPENGVGDLIDAVPTDPTAFTKLRAISQELQIPTPTLSSLIDVAADGNSDALDKLIILAHLAKDDAATDSTLADGLEEIGKTAPDELLEALHRAPAEISDEAINLLGQGIAASDEKQDHPFFEKLKQLTESKPADKLAATAINLSDRLHKILTQPAPAEATQHPMVAPATSTAPHGQDGVSMPGGG